MGVALEQRAVHEGAGVAFVGVADDVLQGARRLARELPLRAGREARAATAAQTRLGDRRDDGLGVVLGEHPSQRPVAAVGEVVVDRLRIDLAVERQHAALLLAVERDVLFAGDALPGPRVPVEAFLEDARADDAGRDDLGDVVGRTRG